MACSPFVGSVFICVYDFYVFPRADILIAYDLVCAVVVPVLNLLAYLFVVVYEVVLTHKMIDGLFFSLCFNSVGWPCSDAFILLRVIQLQNDVGFI
jgi:hypothetical protein